jgi:molybdate transport system substrate-binding protein
VSPGRSRAPGAGKTAPRPGARTGLIAAAVLLALPGCTGTAGTGTAGGTGSDASTSATVTVFAAASLTGAFTALADRFEAENPGATVLLTFAGSADLVSQVGEGAPADVVATADQTTMARLADDGLLVGSPVVFASNTLQIAVPPDNPAGIRTLADLAGPGLNLVVCAPQVPCGAAAETVARAAGVEFRPVSEENSVTDVLGKVRSGEADAGLVYRTDVAAAGDEVRGIEFAESSTAVNEYPIAVTGGTVPGTDVSGGNGADGGESVGSGDGLADAFVDFVTGEAGQGVLAGAGFGAP